MKVTCLASTAAPAPRPDKPLYVTLKDDLSISVGNDTVARAERPWCWTACRRKQGKRVSFLACRQECRLWRELMRVMNLLREAGYLKIALVGLETVGADQSGAAPTGVPAQPAPPANSRSAGAAQ